MGKRSYRSVSVNVLNAEKLVEAGGKKLVVAIDVAKSKQYGAFIGEGGREQCTFYWHHPRESGAFFALCEALVSSGVELEAAMEPTGTYGDPLRVGLQRRGIAVFQVSGKRVRDARELQDGVPSLHDAKATHLIGWLHGQGVSQPWPLASEDARDLSAASEMVFWAAQSMQRMANRLEAKMARHWPELTGLLSLRSATLLELVAKYGSPKAVVRSEGAARKLMRKVGRGFLKGEVIDEVMKSAHRTLGVEMSPLEVKCVQELARRTRRAYREHREAERGLLDLSRGQVPAQAAEMVGAGTAAVLLAEGVDPSKYCSADAMVKAVGLNLREDSSGKKAKNPARHISKRGSSVARQLLYMATLRQIKDDEVVRAWYSNKRERDGWGRAAPKAIIAVARKLVRALWHVWRKQERFDATRLFDVARLNVAVASSPPR